MNVLGIDMGKSDLHAALLQGDRSASKSFPNSQAGIAQLQTWLKNRKAERLHVCLEATGGWSEQVAISLSEAGHVVSIVNPARIKAFAQSEMVRTKTDRIDAALIARFCRLHQPEPWTPPAPEVRILQGLARRQHSLIDMRVEEENRRAAPMVSVAVMASIEATIEHLERRWPALACPRCDKRCRSIAFRCQYHCRKASRSSWPQRFYAFTPTRTALATFPRAGRWIMVYGNA